MSQWPIVLSARLVDGVIRLDTKRLNAALKGRTDCELVLTLERKLATRSHAQNALYWGVYVAMLSEHTGYSPDETHELLKAKFLPKKLAVTDGNGEIRDELVIGGSTTKLNKVDFGEYLRAIQQWAAETLDLYIPDPDDALDDRRPRRSDGVSSANPSR